jgi:hypothetical protein
VNAITLVGAKLFPNCFSFMLNHVFMIIDLMISKVRLNIPMK